MISSFLWNVLINLCSVAIGVGLSLVYGRTSTWWKQRSHRDKFLGSGSTKYVAFLSRPDAKNSRNADYAALASLREHFKTERIPAVGTRPPLDGLPSRPTIIIGSPRYNQMAALLQSSIDAPFEFVSITPKVDEDRRVLAIYDKHGCEFRCSTDPSHGELEATPISILNSLEQDYGILLVGDIEKSDGTSHRVEWLAGIHGIGTLGVVNWLTQHLQDYDWGTLGNVCFLIRTSFTVTALEPLAMDRGYERLDNTTPELVLGPFNWTARKSQTHSIGILCDMGSVLLPFERNRFEHNIEHLTGLPVNGDCGSHIQRLQADFEAGNIKTTEFLTALRSIIPTSCHDRPSVDENALSAAWSDIFWRNEREITLLEKLAQRPNIKVVLISNTDPLRLDYALKRQKLHTLFANGNVVASFQENVNPKGTDDSMLRRGVEILKSQFKGQHFRTIVVDDVRNYLAAARSNGLALETIHYRTYAQLVIDMRKLGVEVT